MVGIGPSSSCLRAVIALVLVVAPSAQAAGTPSSSAISAGVGNSYGLVGVGYQYVFANSNFAVHGALGQWPGDEDSEEKGSVFDKEDDDASKPAPTIAVGGRYLFRRSPTWSWYCGAAAAPVARSTSGDVIYGPVGTIGAQRLVEDRTGFYFIGGLGLGYVEYGLISEFDIALDLGLGVSF